MVLAGFADLDTPPPSVREKRDQDHVAWSVPPQAAAALADRVAEWDLDARPREE